MKDPTASTAARNAPRHSNHPRFTHAKRAQRAKSPREMPELHSREYVGETSGNTIPPITSGRDADDTAMVRRSKVNTNATRKHGGDGTYWRPRESSAYGRDPITTVPKSNRQIAVEAGKSSRTPATVNTATRKPVPSVAMAKNASRDERIRQDAMARHNTFIGEGIEYPPANVAWPASVRGEM